MKLTVVATLSLFLACCGSPDDSERNPDAPPAEVGPNYTAADEMAMADASTRSRVIIEVRDADSGAPITPCDYYAFRFGGTRAAAESRLPIEVSRDRESASPDGRHSFELSAGWYQLELSAEGYRDTWTPAFEVKRGETGELALRMLRANRLRVAVFAPEGAPVARGVLLLTAPGLKSTLQVRDGVGETLLDVDEVTIEVSPHFMPDYRPQSQTRRLERGETTVVVLRLAAP